MAHAISAGLSREYSPAQGRKFALTVGAAFLVLSLIARFRGHPTSSLVLGVLAIALGIAGLALPAKLEPIERSWMNLAKLIAKVTTPVFMGIVYFIIITPIALMRRAMGGSGLVHSRRDTGYWFDRSDSPRSAMERQF